MALQVPEQSAPAIRLLIQVVVATTMAAVISLCAFGLSLLVKLFEAHDAPDWMVMGTYALEIFLWAADLVCFVMMVSIEVIGFALSVWRERSW